MKLLYTTRNGRITVELEADSQADLFRQLARFQEVFENTSCSNGKIESDVVNFVVRTDDEKNEYFELLCVDETKPTLRYAKKPYGQHKNPKGSLFPKGGWVKYNKDTKTEEPLKS